MAAEANKLIGGRYRLVGQVGHGGMQEVWRARDLSLERDVAVKTPMTDSAAKRFASSAQMSARVRHANVASALDYFIDDDGAEFYVEELVNGINLQQCIDMHFTQLDADTTAKVLHLLAKGVAASHRVNVIHRDLKPSNVIVSHDLTFSEVKITDFGIAKLAAETIDAESRKVVIDSSLAGASSTMLGAIPFLAPEVLKKNAPGAAAVGLPADVWSIGAMGFWLLTGTHPFGADMAAVVGILGNMRAPWPRNVGASTRELTDRLKALIDSCMNQDAAARPTAAALAGELEKLRYISVPRQIATVRRKGNYGGVFFGTAADGSSVMLHTGEVVAGGSLSIGCRVSCYIFPGMPDPRAVSVVVMK